MQNVCKNKLYAVHCTAYDVQCTYCIYMRIAPFIYLEIVYLPSQDQRILHALVK